jgi:hypothetical protein
MRVGLQQMMIVGVVQVLCPCSVPAPFHQTMCGDDEGED